ncbi:MAG: flagellar export chaperone FlgN [Lachnospiraceae bacterium]|nr:flagellar export chaperone FlgN [Lachnospiraceae bacterium]
MNEYASFIGVIKEFIQLFETLIPIEQKKLDSAIHNQVSFVEDCMNQEQAAVLRLRGLELKRQKVQKELGMENLTFKQLIEEAPEDIKDSLVPLFNELNEKVASFRSISDSVKDTIAVNLHTIQSALASGSSGNATYSPLRDKDGGSQTHFTSRSV